MSRKLMVAVGATLALALAACSESSSTAPYAEPEPQLGIGNGLPSGGHYTLNIIGVKDKTAAMDGASGGRIFVKLYYNDGNNTGECWSGSCPVDMKSTDRYNKILLQPGPSFSVLDANATDRDGALFQLPDSVSYRYQVFARELGKPGGKADMTTCATVTVDPDLVPNSGDEYQEVLCSLMTYVATRNKGKPTTTNVTDKLLWLQVDLTTLAGTNPTVATCLTNKGYTGTTMVPLFDSCFQSYFWDYDNNGLKLLQLRFYPITTVTP